MSDPVVYKGTPLGDYFEGMPYSMEAGVIVGTGTFETDYGVSSDHETYSYSPTTSENDGPVHDFAPPSTLPRKRFTSSKVPKPLIILNEDISRSTKFYNLFSTSFNPNVPPPETARFQERLRYIICTSQLLSEKLTPSLYPTSADAASTADTEYLELFTRKRPIKYWIGTGGCVIVVALLISWTLRGDGGESKEAKARNLAALALGLLIAVYLYAHTRRRYTRLLRAKTLSLTEALVKNSHAFDTIAHQTLQLIQEIELVSRGYRLSPALPPITRLDQTSTLRRCQNLRATLSASLSLLTSSFHRSSTILREFTTPSLLRQMHQVYNVDDTYATPFHSVMHGRAMSLPGYNGYNDSYIDRSYNNTYEDTGTEGGSLAGLRTSALGMHEQRRLVLCSLLAIHVDPFEPAWGTWRGVVGEVNGLVRIMGDFTRELRRTMDDEQVFELPPQNSAETSTHTRGLTSLSTSIRTLTAKMSLLKQDLSSTLTSIPDTSKQSVFDTYDSIGQDLHSLLQDWQSGRNDLINLLSPSSQGEGQEDGETDGDMVVDSQSVADSGLGISVASNRDDSVRGITSRNKRDSCGDWGVAFPSPRLETPDLEDIFEEPPAPQVLVGTALGKSRTSGIAGGGGKESRGERIERMRKEREELEERKRMREESGRWVGELKDVLGRRKQ